MEEKLKVVEQNRLEAKEEHLNMTFQEKMMASRQERIIDKIAKTNENWKQIEDNLQKRLNK